MRLQYPPNVRVIEVPCTGKVDIIHLLQAFEYGADGVIVVGCMEGDCHYQKGNLYAKTRVKRAKEILDKVGLGGERVAMFNLSSGMGGRFAEIVREMTNKILELGPSPVRGAATKAKAAGAAGEVTA
jgi:F420-non-reducing hydrogenase iron-sulfur subunit